MSTLRNSLYDIRMFLTTDYQCSYLPSRQARNLVADPEITDNHLYTRLASFGFRRSGEDIYRPQCSGCNACRSLRIPAAHFQPNRAQRRIWTRNQDLQVYMASATFQDEHFALFERYISERHAGGGMDPATPAHYWSFISSHWCPTQLYEFRLGPTLLAVAVVDELENGLSAVYTFFDPHHHARSLGTLAVLQQISAAQAQGLDWVYLGYWVEGCRKMAYKTRYNPHEIFISERRDWFS